MSAQLCRDSDPSSRSESDLEIPRIMPRSRSLAIMLFSPTSIISKMEIHMFSLGLFFEAVTPQGMEITCSAPAGRKNAARALGSVLILCHGPGLQLEQNHRMKWGTWTQSRAFSAECPGMLGSCLQSCWSNASLAEGQVCSAFGGQDGLLPQHYPVPADSVLINAKSLLYGVLGQNFVDLNDASPLHFFT